MHTAYEQVYSFLFSEKHDNILRKFVVLYVFVCIVVAVAGFLFSESVKLHRVVLVEFVAAFLDGLS